MIILRYDRDQTAYRRLKATIDATFPPGRFVAIDEDKIVADAATFQELDALLNTAGKTSKEILVVQAGVDYPDFSFMLFSGLLS